MNEEFLAQLAHLKEMGNPLVVVTLVSVKGSAPQEVGARVIVGQQGLLFGTVGGGKIEAKVIESAKEMLGQVDNHQFVNWNLQTDVGMTCGGVVGLFFEKMLPQSDWKIAVFGAGHVSQELIRLLVKLDCSIACIDPRKDWLEKLPEHYRLTKIVTDDMKSVLKSLPAKSYIATVTMGHAFDLPILKEAMMHFDFPYIGAIGSDSKARILKANLLESGVNESVIAKLHCPIGEAFGSNDPFEIAISIVSQLLLVRDARALPK